MFNVLQRINGIVLLLLCCATGALAQSNPSDGSTALALAPGASAGSYSLSGFESINPYSGALNFRLPLYTVAGRGQAQYTITKKIERKWIVDRFFEQFEEAYYYYPEGGSWELVTPGYGPGAMQGRYGGSINTTTCNRGGGAIDKLYTQTLTRLTFTAADGAEFELRDKLTDGAPASVPVCATSGFSRGKVFVTADGTAATFISDIAISDKHLVADRTPFTVSGYLMLRDGTRYRILNGNVEWIRDRNGNKVSLTYSGGNVSQVTDSLNRQITPGTGITFKGYGGASRAVQIATASLSTVLRAGYTTQTYGALFPELNGSLQTQFNPSVVSTVTLPNTKQYKFFYNSYGELARVELPTGGAIEYDWAAGLTNSNASGAVYLGPVFGGGVNWQIYRRVIERRVYPDGSSGSSYASKMTFSRPETIDGSLAIQSVGFVTVDEYNSTGSLLTRQKHYYFGNAGSSLKFHSGVSYTPWKEGKEYKTEVFDTNGTTVLRRIEHTWQQPVSGGSWPLTTPETVDSAKANNPQVTETKTTLEPSGANLVTKQTFTYDKYSNRADQYEYGFGAGTAGSLLRRTSTTYLTSQTLSGTSYDYACDPATNCNASAILANVIHVRNQPKQVSVYDGAGVERGRTTTEFDNYVLDGSDCLHSFHCPLLARSNISNFDSAFTTSFLTRGNPTAITSYLLTNGSVTSSFASYSQYDVAGNVLRVLDPRSTLANNIANTFEYDDRYGSPDTDARANSTPVELTGLSSFGFATKVTNALGHTSYAQFDYYLGKPVNSEDANGIVASGFFNDAFDRPTQIRRAIGTTVASQTTYSYDDTNRIVTASSDRDTNGDNLLVSKVVYDQMGRTVETRQYEGGANYIATQTQYDALGRAFKTSNPFRPWQSETAVWTTQAFDALGRVVSVTTPDNAVVTTSYTGNSVTVTDEAGKVRKNVTDALGRLTDVYEDPSGLNYQTTYLYDTLDSLVKVTQGTQQRFFMYDSLKRLIRARNPEQGTLASLNLSDSLTGNSAWSAGYQYDVSGNLTQQTDARGVVSTYVYDALNRNTSIDYSDTTPDVGRLYDASTNGKGRLNQVWQTGTVASTTYIDSYDALGRPLVQRQQFLVSGVWSSSYQTSRTYNLGGGVTSQTYPSGHTVSYAYDGAGRTSSFTGNLGDGVSRSYATSFAYNSRNQLTQELFGTQTPLYHKLQYNIRGQLWDVRVSTGSDVNGTWNRGALQFFYENTYTHGASGPGNNGNVLKTNHYIPFDEQSSTWAIHDQFYSYDSVNRLSSVSEYFISSTQAQSQQSLQTYTYDRWGNRTINAAQTWGTGVNNKQFTVDTATNRLGVPVGQSGAMGYDVAGNLTTDTYTGVGARTYDAENRMTTAADNTGQTSRYTYDADGKRVRRQVAGSQEQWQVNGFDGELLAEYPAGAPTSAPEKEYGYRDKQLLITATGRFNVALAANGAVATASSTATGSGFSTTGAINGNYRGPWGNSVEGWNDNTPGVVPDWIQVDFAGSKTIDEINVFSLHDNYTVENTPTETQTFTLYGRLAFNVQYWNGSSWVTVTGGNVTGNNKVWRKFTFSPITTSKIRVTINAVPDSWSRVVEIQAFGVSATGEKVQWLVPDHLRTPRIILDQTGALANVKRHDYLPFGEELFAPAGSRSTAQGYTSGDAVRQQFTSQERDVETGLDYFNARYFANIQGRFTSVDPENAGAVLADPQSWNGYSYAGNSPLNFVDPSGLWKEVPCNSGKKMCWQAEPNDSIGSLAVLLNLNFNDLNKHFQKPNVQPGQIYDVSGFYRNNTTVVYANVVQVFLVSQPTPSESQLHLIAAMRAVKSADPEPRSRVLAEAAVLALVMYLDYEMRNEYATYVPPPQNLPAFPDAVRVRRKNNRVRWQDSDGNIYEWDYQHGRVEKYDRRGRHLGEFDPNTGEQTKPADPSRRTEP